MDLCSHPWFLKPRSRRPKEAGDSGVNPISRRRKRPFTLYRSYIIFQATSVMYWLVKHHHHLNILRHGYPWVCKRRPCIGLYHNSTNWSTLVRYLHEAASADVTVVYFPWRSLGESILVRNGRSLRPGDASSYTTCVECIVEAPIYKNHLVQRGNNGPFAPSTIHLLQSNFPSWPHLLVSQQQTSSTYPVSWL